MHRVLFAGVLAVAAAGFAAPAPATCLPSQVTRALSRQYSGWKVLGLGDLVAEDQAILRRTGADQCPGVARGRFDGRHDAYAVALITTQAGMREILVVVTPSPDGDMKIDKLDLHPERVDALSVVSRVPAGVIATTDGSRIRIAHDGVGLEALEAGMLIYYFDGRQYRSVQASD